MDCIPQDQPPSDRPPLDKLLTDLALPDRGADLPLDKGADQAQPDKGADLPQDKGADQAPQDAPVPDLAPADQLPLLPDLTCGDLQSAGCCGSSKRYCYTGTSGCKGAPGGGYTCEGRCRPGTQVCQAGIWDSTCSGQVLPLLMELCNGQDDDCDGKTDETFSTLGTTCSAGKGQCTASGKWVCDAVKTGVVCDAKALPRQTEQCNNKDDDCDGTKDNGRCYSSWIDLSKAIPSGMANPNRVIQSHTVAASGKVVLVGGEGGNCGSGCCPKSCARIVRSVDGGNSWSVAHTGLGEGPIKGIAMEGQVALAWSWNGKGFIRRSADQGKSWSLVHTATTFIPGGGAIVLLGNVALADGYGSVFHSADAGLKWSEVPLKDASGDPIILSAMSIAKPSGATMVAAVGHSKTTAKTPQVLYSIDGGKTWTLITKAFPSGHTSLTGVHLSAAGVLYVAADGFVLRSTDLGATWPQKTKVAGASKIFQGPTGELLVTSITCCGNAKLALSRDGGKTFSANTHKFMVHGESYNIWSVDFGGLGNVYAIKPITGSGGVGSGVEVMKGVW